MSMDPKTPAEAGTPEDLGLARPNDPEQHEQDGERTEKKGEPFDGNFA